MMRPVPPPWRRVGLSMAAGALYDLVFAVAILFFTRPAAALLQLEVPADPVYLRLNGVFLAVIAALYSLAWKSPVRYQAVVPIATTARFVGFVYFAWVWRSAGGSTFLALALADLLFALVHAVLWLGARRDSPQVVTETPER